ncbi:hypothetical protein F5Y12DRAFT_772872, partial [Xylaria sp. FL1777]
MNGSTCPRGKSPVILPSSALMRFILFTAIALSLTQNSWLLPSTFLESGSSTVWVSHRIMPSGKRTRISARVSLPYQL